MMLSGAVIARSAEIFRVRLMISIIVNDKFSTNLRTGLGLRKDRPGDGNFMATGDGVWCGFLRSPEARVFKMTKRKRNTNER